MARFDKYEPHVGGFRARLEAKWLLADVGVILGVGLNASGRVVKGAAATGVLGVLALGKVRNAQHVVDVMTSGEIVDCVGLTAGTVYYVNAATGVLETTAPAIGVNKVRIGHTVEADRLIVRVETVQGA